MGHSRRLFLVMAAILVTWAVGAESIDMRKVREYKCASNLTADDFIKYLKAMEIPVKDGHWAIDGNLVKNITVILGKNKEAHWQFNILAEVSDGTTQGVQAIFKSESEAIPANLMDGRKCTQSLTVGKDTLTRKIKLNDGGLESTQIMTFSENGERMTVTLKAKEVVAILKFKKEPGEITAEDLDM